MNGGELLPIVVGGLGLPMSGTLADVWKGVVGDRVLAWRIANAAKLDGELTRQLRQRGVKLNRAKIPDKVIFSWFEEATQADEPEIQELFARILINAGMGNEDALKKRNIELVSSLTPDDARLLQIFGRMFVWNSPEAGINATAAVRRGPVFTERLRAEGFEDYTSIDTLISSGILRQERQVKPDANAVNQITNLQIGNARALAGTIKSIASRMIVMEDYLVVTTVGLSLLQALAAE